MNKINYQTYSENETLHLGKKLASHIRPGDSILLYGDLGMGKTHFSKGLAEGLGITERVKSPTYTYVNSYQLPISNTQLFHYDLYRLHAGDDLSSIGFDDSTQDSTAVNIVEWADRVTDREVGHIKQRIIVKFSGSGDQRMISIEFFRPNQLPIKEIENYYHEWATPLHVQSHCKAVTNVAMQITKAYADQQIIINHELLYTACMLHDMNRVCDFRTLDRDKFSEEITDAKWKRWLELREQFNGKNHGEIAYEILKGRGFTETAEIIRLHLSRNLIEAFDQYDQLEKRILYYADKRVKHIEVVDLKERFRDGRERYGDSDSKEENQFYIDIEKKTFELEKELFEPLNIQPENIN